MESKKLEGEKIQDATCPDRLINRIRQSIKPQWRLAFWVAFCLGMLTHFYMFTNNLLTWDSLFSLYVPQEMTGVGRPFLRYFSAISSDFNLPLVLGTLSVLYLGLAAAACVECFAIQSKVGICLTAALFVTFPAVTGTFCYLFTADGYMLALFLSICSVICAEREGRRGRAMCLAGAVLLAISLGTYQTYFAVAIVLCILKLLLLLPEGDWKRIGRQGLRYLIMGAIGYSLYMICFEIFQAVRKTELWHYNGIDRLDNLVLGDVPRGIYAAYRQFFSFLLRSNVLTTNPFMTISLTCLGLLGIVLYLRLLLQNRERRLLRLGAAALLVALLPLGTDIFCVMSPDVYIHILMRMPWVIFFVFVLVVSERSGTDQSGSERNGQKWISGAQLAAAVFAAVMAFCFYLTANVAYYNMNEKYEKSYALCIRLADRIEQQKEYYPWMKTVFIGAEPDYMKYPSSDVTTEVLEGYYPARGDYFLNSTDKYLIFFSHFLNISLAPATEEEKEALLLREEVQNMDTFPAEDSVQVVDGILVIKMSGE